MTIEGKGMDWGQTTSNLGSLIAVSQVLLAGEVAEEIKFSSLPGSVPRESDLVKKARDLIKIYVDEYAADDQRKKRELTTEYLDGIQAHVEKHIKTYWSSLDTLANALLQEKTLSSERAFELIEKEISEDLRREQKLS